MTRPWTVYSISDPRTGQIRYVGVTHDARRRFQAHLRTAGLETNHKSNWLAALAREGHLPVFEVLESGNGQEWAAAEMRWIKVCRDLGHPLTNLTNGGEGAPGRVLSAKTKERIRQKHLGKTMGAAARAKMSAAKIGNKPSNLAQLAQISRLPRSADHIAKVAAARRGQKQPAEAVRLQAERLRGRKLSAEHKAKIAAAGIGRVLNADAKARISAAQSGRIRSAEERRRVSMGQRKRWDSAAGIAERIAKSIRMRRAS